MTPQLQEFPKHDPKNGIYGDCFRGALASILDLPISEVPHFARNDPNPSQKWLANPPSEWMIGLFIATLNKKVPL